MRMELSEELHARMNAACSYGDFLAEQGKYLAALEQYEAAWELLPPPAEQWSAATWILAAKGDALFRLRDFDGARRQFEGALSCPDGVGNPFVHLRLGQSLHEL